MQNITNRNGVHLGPAPASVFLAVVSACGGLSLILGMLCRKGLDA